MRTHVTVALSMLTGFGIGAVAVQGLHAQSKPLVFLVNEIEVTDPEKYGAEFTPKAQASVRSSGARFLAIGGAGLGQSRYMLLKAHLPSG
jgi:hypothetical protein